MNGSQEVEEREGPPDEQVFSLDSMEPSDRMKAIDAALRSYFGTGDWLKARNKLFPGAKGYRFEHRSG